MMVLAPALADRAQCIKAKGGGPANEDGHDSDQIFSATIAGQQGAADQLPKLILRDTLGGCMRLVERLLHQ